MDGLMSWIESLLDGTLFAGGIFLVIGIVGVVLLLVSFLLDGIFDALDFGDGPLSLTTISAFMAIFGFASFACVGAGMSTPVATAVGAGAGLLGGAAAWWLSRMIRGAESSTALSNEDIIGSTGAVVLAIPESGLGEVTIVRHGERISLAAYADAPIARGSAIRVTHTVSSTSVRVELIEPNNSRTTEPPQAS